MVKVLALNTTVQIQKNDNSILNFSDYIPS